ncbi:MAG: hypothetical protein ACM32O_14765 [Clostridia bacterium]
MILPVFLLIFGAVIMWQPRTQRWQARLREHLQGDEQRLKQRANTFYLLGFAFVLTAFALMYRLTMG